jgi:hypothetical protein
LRAFAQCLKQAISAWSDDHAPSMGASLSYYTLFSIAPLLLIVIAVAGLAFGEDAARGAIFAQLSGFLGPDGAQAVEALLKSVSLRRISPLAGRISSQYGRKRRRAAASEQNTRVQVTSRVALPCGSGLKVITSWAMPGSAQATKAFASATGSKP